MGGCKWWWQKSQTIVGMPSWGPPNSPCLSEGSSGVGLGPYQFGSCTVRMCSATTYCRKTSGWAQTPRGSHLTATTKALCLCRRESEQLTLHPGAWNSLPSNIFLLKTHSKDYSHRKVCKQDNLINFIFKRTPKTTKAIQNKTCWMKTVNNFFTALTKKKKKWHTPSAFLIQIYLTEVKILLYSDSTYNSTMWLIVLFWEVLRLVN